MKLPENIKSYILNSCKNGQCNIKLIENNVIKGNLDFDVEGMSYTLTERFSVIGYINRIVTYSKKDIKILFNDVLIDQLPVAISHEKN